MELTVHGKILRKVFLLKSSLDLEAGLKSDNQATEFDRSLVSGWKAKEEVIAYDVREIKTRAEGQFVIQSQQMRGKTRRSPDYMNSVANQPFDGDKFNFTKVDMAKEGIFELKTDDDQTAQVSLHYTTKSVS